MNDDVLRSVLLEIVQDLADLRATQAVLAARGGTRTTIADAQDAKKTAKKEQVGAYAKLMKRIESL